MKFRRRLLVAAAALCFAPLSTSQATVVARYDFAGSSSNSSDTDASTASSLGTVGLGVPYINPTAGFPGPSITITADNIPTSGSNPPTAASPGETTGYFVFTLNPVAGFAYDFTTLTFDISNGTANTSAAFVLSLQTSANGYQNAATSNVISGQNNFTAVTFDLSSIPTTSTATEFRLLVRDNSISPSAGVLLDNITLNANVLAIPEPATWQLLAVAAAGTAASAARRRGRNGASRR